MSKTIPIHAVFMDTNSIKGHRWIKNNLLEKIDNIRGERLAQIKFRIPQVVHDEVSRHFILQAEQHGREIEGGLRGLAHMQVPDLPSFNLDKGVFQEQVDALLRKHYIRVIETPYDKISLEALVSRAIQHAPPFKASTDEGIKDAIIAHTILEYKAGNPKEEIAIITKDGRLTEYLQEIFTAGTVNIYEELDDFESNLKLITDKLSSNLLAKAKAKFYTKGNQETLYSSENIPKRIRYAYDALITNSGSAQSHIESISPDKIEGEYGLPNDNSWNALDYKYHIGNTAFIKRSRGRLHWATSVTYKQAYALSTQNYDGMVLNNPSAVIHVVDFRITWSTPLGLSSAKFESLEQTDEKAYVEPFPGIDYESGTTNLTRRELSPVEKALQSLTPSYGALAAAEAVRRHATITQNLRPITEYLQSVQPATEALKHFSALANAHKVSPQPGKSFQEKFKMPPGSKDTSSAQ